MADTLAAELFRNFESLGYNCEFGLVQRHFGVETPSLLRWGHVQPGFHGLVRLIDSELQGLGDEIEISEVGSEYISRDGNYLIAFHTDRQVGSVDLDRFQQSETSRVKFMGRTLLETLKDSSSIFVYHAEERLEADNLLQLKSAIARLGEASLLWVTLAESPSQIGRVERIGDGLLRAYINQFSPREAIGSYCAFDVWLTICQNAYAMCRGTA